MFRGARQRIIAFVTLVLLIGMTMLTACGRTHRVAPAAVQSAELLTTTPTSALLDTATPTPEPTATPISAPTDTLTPTSEPTPTPTLTPMASSLPTPQPRATPIPTVGITSTEGVTLSLPTVARRFRPQIAMLGVAIERFNNESGWEKALELKVHWMHRWQPISWRDVEPNEGEYHWEVLADLERELLRARASGIEPIIPIQFTPQWAQKVVPYTCGPIRADKFEAFAAFMEQVVTRYGSSSPYGVRYWQLGNEPDVAPEEIDPESWFGCWGDPDDPYYGGGYYAEMLKAVYPRIKAADPQAQVVLGGLLLECDPYTMTVGDECKNEWRLKSGLFLEGVMQAGGGDYFDVADVHSYAHLSDLPARMHSYYAWSGDWGGTGLPEKVAFVRQVMAKYGYGDKPVFAGEIALKCDEPTDECYDVAAAFVPRAYAEAYGLNLLGGIYYALISEFKYKGLLLPDFTPRPAFWAYKFMSSQLLGTRYEGSVTDYPGVSGYMFRKDEARLVQILWSTDGTDQVIDLPPGFIWARDKFGNAITPVAGQLTVGWSPIYVELEQGTVK